jgi:CHAD domain-containing protein
MTGARDTYQFGVEQANRHLRRLAFQVGRTIKSPDPNGVHDLRVAIRRFEQALVVFKPCFPAREVKKIRRKLERIMTQAGEVRNCDITADLMSKWEVTESAALRGLIQTRRKQGACTLTQSLDRWVQRTTSSKWRARLTAGDTKTDGEFGPAAIEQTASRLLPGIVKRFFEHGRKAAEKEASAEELHQFRLASKKFRYAIELFSTLYGSSLAERLDQVRRVQTLLGDSNDCETARAIIAECGGADPLDAQLKKRQRRKRYAFRQYWAQELASPGTVRRWTDYFRHFAGKRLAPRKPVARSEAARSAASGAAA